MTERVVVVGGGLAGITAALACVDAGTEVTLLEAGSRLGGAAGSFRRAGLTVDTGQHVFLRCCTAYRSLLDRLDTTSKTRLQERLDVKVLSSAGTDHLKRSRLRAPLHLAGSLARYRRLSPRQRFAAARAVLALRRVDPSDPSSDRVTFADWLSQHGQDDEVIASLWDVITLPTLNLPARAASLAMAAKVFRTGLLEASGTGDIGYALSPLDEVHATPAQRVIEGAGGQIHMRTRVRSVSRMGSSFEVATDMGSIEADAVIVGVDHRSLEGIAGTRWPEVQGLGSSPIVNLHFVFDRSVIQDDFVAVVDSPLQWVFDRTGASGVTEGQYVAISLSGADRYADTPSAQLRATFEVEFGRVFPAASRASVVDFFVTREKHATFRAVPGTAALRPSCHTGTQGLFLAGAYTDTGWPATMEGAVRSGTTAARAALIGLGRTRSLPERVDAA